MPLAEIDFVSPPDVIGTVTSFFGGKIDLDPASSDHANTIVNARRFFKHEDNGLIQQWKAQSVYLYPPRDVLSGSEQPREVLIFNRRRRFQKSAQRVWLEEAVKKYTRGEFEEAIIFLTSTQVALLVTQKLNFDFPICILKEPPELYIDAPGLPKIQNTRCLGFLLYLPSSINTEDRILDFYTLFSPLGRVYY